MPPAASKSTYQAVPTLDKGVDDNVDDKEPTIPTTNTINTKPTTITLHVEKLRLVGYLFFWAMAAIAVLISRFAVYPYVECTNSDGETMYGIECTAIKAKFGYNNICIYFDYTPAVTIVAMIEPLVEYTLALYVVLDFFQIQNDYDNGLLKSSWIMSAQKIFVVLEVIFLALFRMCFVNKVTDDPIPFFGTEIEPLFAHTMGFWGLQISLLLIAIHNSIQMSVRQQTMWCFTEGQTKIMGMLYLVLLLVVTVTKVAWGISIFVAPQPLIPTEVALIVDHTWMLLAAILPIFFAWNGVVKDPPLTISLRNENTTILRKHGKYP